MTSILKNISIAVLCLSMTGCSGAIVGNLAESNFRDEADEQRDDCLPNDDNCVPGLTESILQTLVKQIEEDDLAKQRSTPERASTRTAPKQAASDSLTEADIKAITKKPDAEKTARDREIEALLEELLQARRERIARQNATR